MFKVRTGVVILYTCEKIKTLLAGERSRRSRVEWKAKYPLRGTDQTLGREVPGVEI